MSATKTPPPGSPPPSGALAMTIDYGPLLVFFAVTFLAPAEPMRTLVSAFTRTLDDMTRIQALLIARVIVATAAFILATLLAILVSKVRLGRVSPMLWVSGALILVFGGLTIYFADARFIKMKPTFVYAIFAGVLLFGLLTRRPILQQLLGATYPGLRPEGWLLLTRNWTVFFVLMAISNEIVWRWTAATMSEAAAFRAWTLYKFPGCTIVTLVFAAANLPMLMRHGLQLGSDTPIETTPEG